MKLAVSVLCWGVRSIKRRVCSAASFCLGQMRLRWPTETNLTRVILFLPSHSKSAAPPSLYSGMNTGTSTLTWRQAETEASRGQGSLPISLCAEAWGQEELEPSGGTSQQLFSRTSSLWLLIIQCLIHLFTFEMCNVFCVNSYQQTAVKITAATT